MAKRARCNRVLTLANVSPVVFATSSYEKPSMSRSKKTSLNSALRDCAADSMARRSSSVSTVVSALGAKSGTASNRFSPSASVRSLGASCVWRTFRLRRRPTLAFAAMVSIHACRGVEDASVPTPLASGGTVLFKVLPHRKKRFLRHIGGFMFVPQKSFRQAVYSMLRALHQGFKGLKPALRGLFDEIRISENGHGELEKANPAPSVKCGGKFEASVFFCVTIFLFSRQNDFCSGSILAS
jgi:hypothetical protein